MGRMVHLLKGLKKLKCSFCHTSGRFVCQVLSKLYWYAVTPSQTMYSEHEAVLLHYENMMIASSYYYTVPWFALSLMAYMRQHKSVKKI